MPPCLPLPLTLLPQKTALAKIQPELAQIDAALQNLRIQQAALVNNN